MKLALLYSVSELVCQQPAARVRVQGVLCVAEKDVVANSIGERIYGTCRFSGRRIIVDADVSEIMTEGRLQCSTDRIGQRLPVAGDHRLHCARCLGDLFARSRLCSPEGLTLLARRALSTNKWTSRARNRRLELSA